MIVVLVAIGGACGAALRGVIGHGMNSRRPWGTFAVNIAAAFCLGLAASLDGRAETVVGIGVLGALSTWSSLAHEVAMMVRRGDRANAAGWLLASIVLGIGAAWVGLVL